jgi:hypothetical protein
MKTSKAFRLSQQALEALRYLSEQTGSNETAILEMSLAYYRRAFDNSKLEELKEIIGKNADIGQALAKAVILSPNRKKRKRY